MNKTEKLEELFRKWAELHKIEDDNEYNTYHKYEKNGTGYIPKQNFYGDGILFEDEYTSAKCKILFIAKECHAYPRNVINKTEVILDNNKFWAKEEVEKVKNGEKSHNNFLRGIAMLYHALINNEYSTPHKDISELSGMAFMNLNKRGGYDYCVWETLEGYVKKYRKEISEQIRIIDPDIIVCCGESVKWLVENYKLAENAKIKCSYHPSFFSVSDSEKLSFLQSGEKGQSSKKNKKVEECHSRACRGYILDTNNKYDLNSEREMLIDSRAYAYGSARYQLAWFTGGDYVLLYSAQRKGVIAVGQVLTAGEDDKTDKSWWEVKPIVPVEFNNSIQALDINEVNEIVYENAPKKINMRGTVKRKIIEYKDVEIIIDRLKSKYGAIGRTK